MPVSFEGYDLGPRSDLDCRNLFDPTNQVSGHAHRETVGPDEHVDPPTGPPEKHRRLTCRVGTSDDDDLVAVAKLRFFHERRVVVDAGTFELREIGEWRLTVSGSCGDDDRASGNRCAVTQPYAVPLRFAGQSRGTFRDHDGSAKLLGLGIGAFSQLLA